MDTRQDHDEMIKRLQERQDNMVYQHDQHARDLPPLHNGQAVRFRDQDGRWKPATVLNKTPNPRSYILATPSTSTIRRNRNHIRDNATQPVVKRVSFGSPTAVQPAFGSTTAVQPAFGSTTAVQPVLPVVYPTVPVETPGQRDRAVNDATTPVTTTNGSTENIVQSKENGRHPLWYGAPFSHLFTELKISAIEVHITAIQLEISPIQLKISPNQLEISTNRPI